MVFPAGSRKRRTSDRKEISYMRKMETLLLLSPELSVEERETILKTMD